jgi:superfamily II DNA helicase RecQ
LLKRKAGELNVRRVHCCTATATKIVSDDIMDAFAIHRKNLHLDAIVVRDDSDRLNHIVKCLKIDLASLATGSAYRGSGILENNV